MSNSQLEEVIQRIERLTPNERLFLARYLDDLTHSRDRSPITRSRLKLLESRRSDVFKLALVYGASNIKIVESNSEIILIVDIEKGRTLFDLGGFLIDLKDLLGFEVAVFTPQIIKDSERENLLKNAIAL